MAKASTQKKETPTIEGPAKPATAAAGPDPGAGPVTEADTKDALKALPKPPGNEAQPLPKPAGAENTAALPKPGVDAPKGTLTKFFKGQFPQCRAETIRQTYCVQAEDGHTVEDVTQPEYWKNQTRHLEYGYRIEVLFTGADPRWLDLLVVDKGPTWAKVKILQNVSLAQEAQEALGLRLKDSVVSFKPVFKGGNLRWTVQRLKDKAEVSNGHASEKDAEQWIADHLKALRS